MKSPLVCGLLFLGLVGAQGESRFGRPVVTLADPIGYGFFKLDDNTFSYLAAANASVSCIAYRSNRRHYVEVGVFNRSAEPLVLGSDFVTLEKPGYTVFRASTFDVARGITSRFAGPFIPTPPPPPTSATTTYSGTAITIGNNTFVNGTARTTVDDSSGWHALGQAIAARRYYRAQSRERSFAAYLVTFGHEYQSLIVEPWKAQLYVFIFDHVKDKKGPFNVIVTVGKSRLKFAYKE